MEYQSKASISIRLSGDNFNPHEFTKLIDIRPTSVGIKGEEGKYINNLQVSFWEYRTKNTDALEGLDLSMNNLIMKFIDKVYLINNYSLEKKIDVMCYVIIESINTEDSGVFFNKNFINFINDLGAEIEVDVYTL
ncbi:conserved hypothetical protein [Tenacibaculum dicentrarchi]|nr:conserved hypothetical protein [Tenacibaculum dicentrarchi]